MPRLDFGRHLIRMRYAGGLTIYLRHDPNLPGRANDMFFHERLHDFEVPGYVPSYDSPIDSDFWEESEDPSEFERIWQQTESGPVWVQEPQNA